VSRALAARPNPLRLVFWNLLQAQAPRRTAAVPLLPAISATLGAQDACFYFGGVRVLAYAGDPAANPKLAPQLLAAHAG
jgi:S-adenosylmethionine-diacylglycerol 3-amino-3-carboxypropyl transferase